MYKHELDKYLSYSLPKALLLHGENDYLITQYIKHYIEKLNAKEDLLALYFDEWHFPTAKEYLSQSSLFGGVNLLIIRHDKKLPKKELDALIDIAHKIGESYLIFAFSGEPKEAVLLQSSFVPKKDAQWARVFPSQPKEAIPMLQQKAQKLNMKIDHFALSHLYQLLNNNLELSMNELDKLAILEREITSKEIDRLVYSAAPLKPQQFLLNLFEKKPVIETIGMLLDLGEEENDLLRATQQFVLELFLYQAYIKLHGSPDSKAILGYKPPADVEARRKQIATRIKSQKLLEIHEQILDRSLAISKAKGGDKEVLLYGMYLEIQRIL